MIYQHLTVAVVLVIHTSCISVLGDPGTPLILTPLIKSGNLEAARNASRVGLLKEGVDVESYSGYFNVDNDYDSNLFFWYFPAEVNYTTAPVLVWLQGGPGQTSMMALFTENGPYVINTKNELERRKIYWSQKYNLIFIDNPVGTGFSFTGNENGYSRNETHAAKNLHKALIQFFTLFSELQSNPFYITGESYAGKWVPALGYTIHTNNHNVSLNINLQGLAIGNGACDPENMMAYADYLFQLGIIDSNTRDYLHGKEAEILDLIKQEKYEEAYWEWHYMIGSETKSFLYNETGFSYHYNLLYNDNDPVDNNRYEDFLQQDNIRAAIHVGSKEFNRTSSTVAKNLRSVLSRSVRPWVETLLEHYKVLMFSGQLDLIIPYPLTVNFLQHLQWSAADEYKTAKRYKWYVGEELAGYVKTAGNLTEVLVRNAGHLVPSSQPLWAMDLITRFVEDQNFY